MEVRPDTVHSTEDYVFATAGPVLFAVWRAQATQQNVDVFAQLCDEIHRRHPHFALIGVAEPDAPMPDGEARRGLSKLLRDYGQQIVSAEFIIEGGGFRAASLRSVVTALTMLIGRPFPFHIVPTMAKACSSSVEYLAKHGVAPPIDRLLADIQRLRAAPY